MAAGNQLQIVWFKRDLRVQDHRALALACQHGPVLPLFVVEPHLWRQPDMSARQWAFVAECLTTLRADLASLGQPLIIRVGDVVDVLDRARQRFGVFTLWSHEETGNGWTYARDQHVAAWAKRCRIQWREERQAGVIRRLKKRDGWAKRWDAFMAEDATPPPTALPPLSDIDMGAIPCAADIGLAPDPCPERQAGGRGASATLLESFLNTRGAPYRKAMSNPISGAAHCSRLSPHLSWGTLSMREVAQATWARQRQLKAAGIKTSWNGAMSSFESRLHWRDHFMQKLEDEPALEFRNLHPAYDGLRPTVPDEARLSAWRSGQTGFPFVDACMRSLLATGWINFRMRAMLMAVASYHLWLDWRKPGEHLARLFTDYEPGIHWPQAQMQSGTTGINTVRIYNPVKQGYDQDPQGVFVRQWIPEIAHIPTEYIHEPWKWEGANSVLDKTYPIPIVDHLTAGRYARQKVWAIRKDSDFRTGADKIQKKHGSRKSGIASSGHQRRANRNTDQLVLPLLSEKGDLMKKADLPSKICPVCQRPFSWRKKWERNWDNIVYCSERCRRNKKQRAENK